MGCGLCRDDEAKARNEEVALKSQKFAPLLFDKATVSHASISIDATASKAKFEGCPNGQGTRVVLYLACVHSLAVHQRYAMTRS
jgi:hypothetical protein